MTHFGNSLTWRDTVKYAVSVYSFLILGKGEMAGTSFANIIQAHYDCSGPREQTIIKEIETHVTRINATHKGTEYFVIEKKG